MDVSLWTKSDVAKFLDKLGLPEYLKTFAENDIDGETLIELSEEDLATLGVKSVGHRKKILNRLKQLKSPGLDDGDSSSETGSQSGSSASGTATSKSSTEKSKKSIKLYYKTDIAVIQVNPSITLRKLELKACEEFGRRKLQLFQKDSDGDKIRIKSDKDVQRILKGDGIKIVCERRTKRTKEAGQISSAETGILEGLVDAVIVIDTVGKVLFFNESASKIWGYSKNDVIGENVKMLMPDSYASQHDRFISNYLKSGKSSIIGKTRTVLAKHKNGSQFTVELSLTERKEKGNHIFTGTAKPVGDSKSSANDFSSLNLILEGAIVIDESASVIFINKAASDLLGYSSKDIVGQNVKLLMPSPYRENHDKYISNYLITGERHVINETRAVMAEMKDGTIIPVQLSVTENENNGKKLFTGILRKRESQQVGKLSVLKNEREVISSLLIPGIIIDSKCNIQAFNSAAQNLFGYDLSDVIGQNIKMLCNQADRAKHDSYVAAYLGGGTPKIIGKERQVIAVRKDGTQFNVLLSVTRKDDENGKPLFTGMMHSVRK